MYKIPKIPIFPELLGVEKRVQRLQQQIAELDWLEYSFGVAKRLTIEDEQKPFVYVGTHEDPLDMSPWPNDVYKAYSFWDLTSISDFEYFENTGKRRYPQVQQPIALIVCLDNEQISHGQDHNITHSICRNELISKLNFASIKGIFQITGILENKPVEVFDGYDVDDELMDPHSMLRIEGVITYTQDC